MRAAQAKLRDVELPLSDARSAAARRIVAEVRPEYLKLCGESALAVLRQRADELVAIERVFAMRRELDAHRISMATLPIPPFERKLERTEWHTRALIEAGAIKPGDLPPNLRKAWSLRDDD